MNVYNIDGKLVGFRPLEEKDLNGNWFNWFNDPEVTKYLSRGAIPNTKEQQRLFLQNNIADATNQIIFAVVDKKSRRHIGVASIRNIDWVHRNGDIAIIIGEKDFWRGGYALEIYYLIVKYSFETLNLHRLVTATIAENKISLKYCEILGFKNFGVGKEVFFKSGHYLDCVYSELLENDWKMIQDDSEEKNKQLKKRKK
ncbi:MAG: GNAT family N-acetyltransferase [Candidatus Omnitrophota bacterium]